MKVGTAMRIPSIACLLVGLSICASPQCQVPRFHKGRDFLGESRGTLYVSVEPRDFTIQKIVCLIEHLKKPEWTSVAVLIFSSKEAADNFLPDIPDMSDMPQNLWEDWARHQHVSYFLEPGNKESLYITPFGHEEDPGLDTRTEFPIPATPRCRLNVFGRCLMAVPGGITYPENAQQRATHGRVTLTAVIERNGSVGRVEIKDADIRPSGFKDELLAAATASLKKWQFDASDRETPFQIDYSYVIDSGPLAWGQSSGQVTVVPMLPWNVEIRVKAPKATKGRAAQPKPQ